MKTTNTNRFVLCVLVLILMLGALGTLNAQAGSAADQPVFREFLDSSYREIQALHPTSIIIKKMASIPASAGESEVAFYKGLEKVFHSRVDEIHAKLLLWDRGSLSEEDKLDFDLFRLYLENEIACRKTERFYLPWTFPDMISSGILGSLMNGSSLGNPTDAETWLRFLENVPTLLSSDMELFKEREGKATFPPRIVLSQYSQFVAQLTARPSVNHEVIRYFRERLASMPGISPETAAEYERRAVDIMSEKVYPAYASIKDELDRMAERAPQVYGLAVYPGGKEAYEAIIRQSTGESIPAETLHSWALSEVEQIEKEFGALPGEAGQSPYARAMAFMATEPSFSASNPEWVRETVRQSAPRISAPPPRMDRGKAASAYLPGLSRRRRTRCARSGMNPFPATRSNLGYRVANRAGRSSGLISTT